MCWVEISMARSEFFAIFLIRCHIFSRDLRSRLEVGSSRIINFASPINAIAIESFLFAPGEMNFTYLLISLSRVTSFIFSLTHFSMSLFYNIPLSLQTSSRCSLQVNSSNKNSFCWHNLTYERNYLAESLIETWWPSKFRVTSPLLRSSASSPVSILTRVVFPEPFVPSRHMTSPAYIFRVKCLITWFYWNDFLRPSIYTRGLPIFSIGIFIILSSSLFVSTESD